VTEEGVYEDNKMTNSIILENPWSRKKREEEGSKENSANKKQFRYHEKNH